MWLFKLSLSLEPFNNLSITFSSVSHEGKRLVCCDRKNISPELTSHKKTEEMEELKEKAVHQEG